MHRVTSKLWISPNTETSLLTATHSWAAVGSDVMPTMSSYIRKTCLPAIHLLAVAGGIMALSLSVASCRHSPPVPVGDAAERIRKLALAYVQFAATNNGVGPADQDSLTKFLAKRNGLSSEEAKAYFVSPRDNQPYIVRWGQRPLGSGPIGPEIPKPSIIVIERTGAGGTRYVADGLVGIRQLTAEEFDQVVPKDATNNGR